MMLNIKDHLIPENKEIDYYVWRYPGLLRAFFQCVKGGDPVEPYSPDIQEHIQIVIEKHNRSARYADALMQILHPQYVKRTYPKY